MKSRHVVKAQQFDVEILDEIFRTADEMENIVKKYGGSDELKGKIMATLFYEPSTRTRLSFESAMIRLGGRMISTENARDFSSSAKGETLADTMRVISGYCDIIVLRHYESGSAEIASQVSSVPVINAGDGAGQHPTQALLDVYTIYKEFHRVKDLSIAMVGDLANGRTVRSLCYLMAKFPGNKIYFVAPDIVKMKDDIKIYLKRHNIEFSEEQDLHDVVSKADIVYMTRIQKERFVDRAGEYEQAKGKYIIDKSVLECMKKESIILHPLPRVDEITLDVDADSRARYFQQSQNGVYVRMALLHLILA